MNIHRIVACTVVCYPLDRGRQSINDLLVKSSDLFGGFVLPVNPNSTFILATWTKLCQEGFTIRRIDVLPGRVLVLWVRDSRNWETYNYIRNATKQLFNFVMSPYYLT